MTSRPAHVPRIVLDTNVLFDLLLFGDSSCEPLEQALQAGRLQWLATGEMRDEFFHVLARGTLDAWQPDLGALNTAWSTHCELVEPSPPEGAASRILCSDTADQMFIQLALCHRVQWLLSKDRAVLKLAPRMRAFDVEVMTPAVWADHIAAAI